MKTLNLMLLTFLVAGSAAAQSLPGLPDAPGVVVLNRAWRRIERNPKLDEDPLLINEQVADSLLAQKRAVEANAGPGKTKRSVRPVPNSSAVTRQTLERGSWALYVYEAKVKNTGTNTIRKLVWEYVFFDPATNEQVGRRHYESSEKIRPGKSKNLVGRSGLPPLAVVDAKQLRKAPPAKPLEQVIIQRIEYADGSVWTRVYK